MPKKTHHTRRRVRSSEVRFDYSMAELSPSFDRPQRLRKGDITVPRIRLNKSMSYGRETKLLVKRMVEDRRAVLLPYGLSLGFFRTRIGAISGNLPDGLTLVMRVIPPGSYLDRLGGVLIWASEGIVPPKTYALASLLAQIRAAYAGEPMPARQKRTRKPKAKDPQPEPEHEVIEGVAETHDPTPAEVRIDELVRRQGEELTEAFAKGFADAYAEGFKNGQATIRQVLIDLLRD